MHTKYKFIHEVTRRCLEDRRSLSCPSPSISPSLESRLAAEAGAPAQSALCLCSTTAGSCSLHTRSSPRCPGPAAPARPGPAAPRPICLEPEPWELRGSYADPSPLRPGRRTARDIPAPPGHPRQLPLTPPPPARGRVTSEGLEEPRRRQQHVAEHSADHAARPGLHRPRPGLHRPQPGPAAAPAPPQLRPHGAGSPALGVSRHSPRRAAGARTGLGLALPGRRSKAARSREAAARGGTAPAGGGPGGPVVGQERSLLRGPAAVLCLGGQKLG